MISFKIQLFALISYEMNCNEHQCTATASLGDCVNLFYTLNGTVNVGYLLVVS